MNLSIIIGIIIGIILFFIGICLIFSKKKSNVRRETLNEIVQEFKIPSLEINKPINPVNIKKMKKFANLIFQYNEIVRSYDEFTYSHI